MIDSARNGQSIEVDVHNTITGKGRKYRGQNDHLDFKGYYPKIEHIRDGKVIGVYEFANDITNVGKNLILNVMFGGVAATAAAGWYGGLINGDGTYSALSAADIMTSHAGWTEFIDYTQGTRVAWGPGTSSSQSITNASPMTFDINNTGTLRGIFIVNHSTKSGTSGTLWATGLFSAAVPVVNGDQMKVTYTVSN